MLDCWQCRVNDDTWLCVCVMSDNDIGVEGAKALGPHLAKLSSMTTLELGSASRQECLSMHSRCLFVGNVASIMCM